MNITYQNTNQSIRSLLEMAESGKAVIPSIQRPFVWGPEKVAKYIDSLLRGWPFGTMLFLRKGETDKSPFPFRCVERNVCSTKGTIKNLVGNTYTYMVLDGQQRLQSLFVAFKGSYTCPESEWRAINCRTDEDGKGKKADEQVEKHLCFNLSAYSPTWEITTSIDVDNGESAWLEWKSEQELKELSTSHIKLAEIYTRPIDIYSLEEKYRIAAAALEKRMACIRASVTGNEYSIMGIPNAGLVPTLVINMPKSEGDFEGQIVDIFTRLNTAGTPLTREQILAAEIKNAWEQFPEKIDALKEKLGASRYFLSGHLQDDDLVSGFNLLLKVETKTPNINEVYRQLGKNQDRWNMLWARFEVFTSLLLEKLCDDYGVRYSQEYNSFHAIWFAISLLHITQQEVNDELDAELIHEIVRWLMVSGWAKIWANRSGQSVKEYTSKLIEYSAEHTAKDVLKTWLTDSKLQENARITIDNMKASARGQVRLYYTALWVWMHMDPSRVMLMTAFAHEQDIWAVDHIIPADWFKNNPNYYHTFNRMGNCWLLDTETNTTKGKMPFEKFLASYKFKNDNSIAQNILATGLASYNETCINQEETIKLAIQAIEEREELIKQSLRDYIRFGSELYYDKTQKSEQRAYSPLVDDIFKGKEFINSAEFLSLKGGSPSSYLSHVRNAYKALNISFSEEHNQFRIDGTIVENPDDYFLRKLDNIKKVASTGWKLYLQIVTGIPIVHRKGKVNASLDSTTIQQNGQRRSSKQPTMNIAQARGNGRAVQKIRNFKDIPFDEMPIYRKIIHIAINMGCTKTNSVSINEVANRTNIDENIFKRNFNQCLSDYNNCNGLFFIKTNDGSGIYFAEEAWAELVRRQFAKE